MDNEHIVTAFDDDLNNLQNKIVEMGGLVEKQLLDSIGALLTFDMVAAKEVVLHDKHIDNLELEIDEAIVRLLALRSPVAADLRSIISCTKISCNLERIGDYSKNISKRTLAISDTGNLQLMGSGPVKTVSKMAEIVQNMIKNVLDAYIEKDATKADDVRAKDEDVDHIHSGLYRELLTYMLEDPKNISLCTHLLFVSKNVERMGDHVTSIAEHVHFIVHGKIPEESRIKRDKSSSTYL